jgi:hypothetical protein
MKKFDREDTFSKLEQLAYLQALHGKENALTEKSPESLTPGQQRTALLRTFCNAIEGGLKKAGKRESAYSFTIRIKRPTPLSWWHRARLARRFWFTQNRFDIAKIDMRVAAWLTWLFIGLGGGIALIGTGVLVSWLAGLAYMLGISVLWYAIYTAKIVTIAAREYPKFLFDGDESEATDVEVKINGLGSGDDRFGYVLCDAATKQSRHCRTPPQWLTPALLEAHLTEFVDQLEDHVVAELPAATWIELTKT